MRTMIDIALHRWMLGFTIDNRPRNDEGFNPQPRVLWTGFTIYIGPFAFGFWFNGHHRFGSTEARS